jgi:hypothetical protein
MGCVALVLAVAHAPAWGAYALSLGSGQGSAGQVALSVTSDDPVVGLRVAVEIDPTKLQITHVDRANNLGGTIGAEHVATEIFANGFTLDVVMDAEEPFDGQTIPAGTTELAMIDVRAKCPSAGSPAALTFVDDVLGSPKLSNLIVLAGTSIGVGEGLQLNHGSFTPECDTQRLIVETTALPTGVMEGAIRILVENTQPVEGFVVAVGHDPNLATLQEINISGTATEQAGAEFVHDNLYPDGGTLGVILDFDAPFDGQTLAANGQEHHVANFVYRYAGSPITAPDCVTVPLRLEDDTFGDPPLVNLLVEEQLSITEAEGLTLVDGSIMFCEGEREIVFSINDDGVTIRENGCAEVGYFYTSAADPIQGVSIASCYDDRLTVGDINLEGSITASVNAEFVNHHAESGELIIGILVDSTPPVSPERMFPSTDVPTLLCRIEFCDQAGQISCGEMLDITFCDGAVGAGSVPINNRAAVYHQSIPPKLIAGTLEVGGAEEFRRGDCNFDGEVDIADPPSILGHVFSGVFYPPCMDACDANDDGTIDLADSVKVLRWLFKFGSEPPAPGPFVPGPDPTPDLFGSDLGCEASGECD